MKIVYTQKLNNKTVSLYLDVIETTTLLPAGALAPVSYFLAVEPTTGNFLTVPCARCTLVKELTIPKEFTNDE